MHSRRAVPRLAQTARAASLLIELPAAPGAARAAAEGAVLGAYRFTRYLTGERLPKSELERVTLATREKITPDAKKEVEVGAAVGESICLARDLINEPPNELYPATFAAFAERVATETGLGCRILGKDELTEKGFKLMLAVSQGSVREPALFTSCTRPLRGSRGSVSCSSAKASRSTPVVSASSPRRGWKR